MHVYGVTRDTSIRCTTSQHQKPHKPVDELPDGSARLHVDESLSNVLGEDGDDRDPGLEGHGRETGPLLPHDLVVGGAELGFEPTTRGDPDELAQP